MEAIDEEKNADVTKDEKQETAESAGLTTMEAAEHAEQEMASKAQSPRPQTTEGFHSAEGEEEGGHGDEEDEKKEDGEKKGDGDRI